MLKNNPRKMTLDKLAHMVAEGFESVEQRMAKKEDLNEVKLDLKEVKKKVEKIDYHVDEIYDMLNQSEKDHLRLEKRVSVLEHAAKH